MAPIFNRVKHEYFDLLVVMRKLTDTNKPTTTKIYCPERGLSTLLKYLWEAGQASVPRDIQLLSKRNGEKSTLDVSGKVVQIPIAAPYQV